MSNSYTQYYTTQAGSGLAGFQGVRYQKGHGFFGRILSKAVYPLLRFLGKKAVNVGADLASDIIVDKKNWKEAAKGRLDEAAQDIVKAGVKKAKQFAQQGSGRRKGKHFHLNSIKIKKQKKSKPKKKTKKKKPKKSIKRKAKKRKQKSKQVFNTLSL